MEFEYYTIHQSTNSCPGLVFFCWCILKIHAYILLVCLSENRTVSFKEANNFSWLEGLILAIFQFAYEEKIFSLLLTGFLLVSRFFSKIVR